VQPTSDAVKWQAVIDRDSDSEGRFYYGVSSTGIYCRPTCPSRRPTRARVAFFDTPELAEAAGYRPCRRCEPRTSQPSSSRQIESARQYLDDHLDETVTLERLGRVTRMSPYHLQRVFKKAVGLSPRAYASARRLDRMKSQLKNGATVSRATYDAGFASGSRAYAHARNGLGMTPGSYRNGGRDMTISHTVVATPVGQLLVAATDRGVCSVMLGDSAEELEAALQREYPAATLRHGNGELREYAEQVLERLAGKAGRPLPLDIGGTAFQLQVWDALRRIPPGQTRSYHAIARELGRPSAARAVARACATNHVAVVIPCHRAVRETGELGGYRWGIERKQHLLERERNAAEA
jgi:AraC family transcriptional regulator, regulatory protein of adaptative response / methylated-DNA-[protein]-cysteine methyltransferase